MEQEREWEGEVRPLDIGQSVSQEIHLFSCFGIFDVVLSSIAFVMDTNY